MSHRTEDVIMLWIYHEGIKGGVLDYELWETIDQWWRNKNVVRRIKLYDYTSHIAPWGSLGRLGISPVMTWCDLSKLLLNLCWVKQRGSSSKTYQNKRWSKHCRNSMCHSDLSKVIRIEEKIGLTGCTCCHMFTRFADCKSKWLLDRKSR